MELSFISDIYWVEDMGQCQGSGLENMKKQLMKLLDADGDKQLTK